MKNFAYAAPRSETELLELLSAEPGHTEILAGGTDLVGLMKKMVVTPKRVVTLMEIPSLKQIQRFEDGSLAIGAAVTLDELLASSDLTDYQAVTDAVLGINSMQLQCQGTVGGELCRRPRCWFFREGHGLLSPLAEQGDNRYHAILGNSGPAKFVSSSRLAPGLIALGASLRVLGPTAGDVAIVPLDSFFQTPRHPSQRETILKPDQVVTHVILPPAAGSYSATYEVRHGSGPEMPLVAAAANLAIHGGVVQEARIVLGQVAPVPWPAPEAARLLRGNAVTVELAEQAGRAALAAARPLSQNAYKVSLAETAVKRSILRAAGLETGGF